MSAVMETQRRVWETQHMKLTQVFTYRGGPLDGQTALPTAQRGKQYTTYRTAEGKALRASSGDRYNRAENNHRPHPGFYARVEVTGVDLDTGTAHGEYTWRPERKADNR